MKKKELRELKRVLELKFQLEQTEFARLRRAEARLKSQLTEVQEARSQSTISGASILDHGLAMEADLKWQRWVDQRRKEINIEISLLRSKALVQNDKMRKCLRRLNAINDIVKSS